MHEQKALIYIEKVKKIFLLLNESKTEVIVFDLSENAGSRSIDLDYLAPFTSSPRCFLGSVLNVINK